MRMDTELMGKIVFVRHGMTAGNELKKYIGSTDEPLCPAGRAMLEEYRIKKHLYPEVSKVFTSPMKRCIETAEMIYPDIPKYIIQDFKECDFGLFEQKGYEELKDTASYRSWIDSSGRMAPPGGESKEEFQKRCVNGFYQMLSMMESTAACVVHGGTIMSILEYFGCEKKNFYDYQCKNGMGFLTEYHLDKKGKVEISWIRPLESVF